MAGDTLNSDTYNEWGSLQPRIALPGLSRQGWGLVFDPDIGATDGHVFFPPTPVQPTIGGKPLGGMFSAGPDWYGTAAAFASISTAPAAAATPVFHVLAESPGTTGVLNQSITLLDSGDVVIPFQWANFDPSPGAVNENSAFDVFDENGNRVGSEVNETVSFDYHPNVVNGPTSNTFWMVSTLSDPNTGIFDKSIAREYQISGNTITKLQTKTILDTSSSGDNSGNENALTTAVKLSNGDYAIVWTFGVAPNLNSGSTKVEIVDSNFNVLTGPTTISSAGNSNEDQRLFVSASGMDVNVTYAPQSNGHDYGVSFTVTSAGAITNLSAPRDLTSSLPSSAILSGESQFANGNSLAPNGSHRSAP